MTTSCFSTSLSDYYNATGSSLGYNWSTLNSLGNSSASLFTDSNGTYIGYKNKQTNKTTTESLATNASATYKSELNNVAKYIKAGSTSQALSVFNDVVEGIKNANPYYNIDDSSARSIAEMAFQSIGGDNEEGLTLSSFIDEYVDSASTRASKQANDFTYYNGTTQSGYTAEELYSLMGKGEEFDKTQLAKLQKSGAAQGEADETMQHCKYGAINTGIGTAAALGLGYGCKALAAAITAGTISIPVVGWIVGGIAAGVAIAYGVCKHNTNKDVKNANKEASREADRVTESQAEQQEETT